MLTITPTDLNQNIILKVNFEIISLHYGAIFI